MIYVKSKNKCLKVAKEQHPNITDELELLEYLPESIFSKRFNPVQSDDSYHVVNHVGYLWFVPFEFTETK